MAKASCRSGRRSTRDRIADNSSRRVRLLRWTSCTAERTLATDDVSASWFLCRSAKDDVSASCLRAASAWLFCRSARDATMAAWLLCSSAMAAASAEAEELEGPDPAPAVAWPASAPAETYLVATPAMAAFPAASEAWKRSNMASKARMSDSDLPF